MKYRFTTGPKHKCEGDMLFWLHTEGVWEPISLARLFVIVNQLAINELKIKKAGNWPRFLFEEGINGALLHAKKGIDWADPASREHVKNLCKDVYVSFPSVEIELRKGIQRCLDEFENGSDKGKQ